MKESFQNFNVPKTEFQASPIDDATMGKAQGVERGVRQTQAKLQRILYDKYFGRELEGDVAFSLSDIVKEMGGAVSEEEISAHLAYLRAQSREILRSEAKIHTERGALEEDRRRRIERVDREVVGRVEKERIKLIGILCAKQGKDPLTLTDEEKSALEESIISDLSRYEALHRSGLSSREDERIALNLYKQSRGNIARKEAELLKSPEGFYPLHAKELGRYVHALSQGERIIETPYVREKLSELKQNVLLGIPTILEGELGSGKTELASHLCTKEFGMLTPYLLSLQRDTDPSELGGKTTITVTGPSGDMLETERKKLKLKYVEMNEREMHEWKEKHQSADEKETDRAWQVIKEHNQTLFEDDCERNIVTKFVMSQIFKAMEEGKPVIIDEFNAAPHALLIGLNHLLTRRPGDKVRMQQNSNSEITIKPGFCFIFTGNMGDRYSKHRETVDSAFLSRLHLIEYDYLPQEKAMTYDEFLDVQNRAHTEGKKSPYKHELFDLLVAMTMDGSLTSELTDAEFREIWNLASRSSVLQANFAGKEESIVGGRAGVQGYRLKKTVPSVRNLKSVVDSWKRDGFTFPLDYYLYTQFISQAKEGGDRSKLFSEYQLAGFFSDTEAFQYQDTDLTISVQGATIPNPNFACDISAFHDEAGSVYERYVGKATARSSRGIRDIVDHVYGEMPQTSYGAPAVTTVEDTHDDTENTSNTSLEVSERILHEGKEFDGTVETWFRNLSSVEKKLVCSTQ